MSQRSKQTLGDSPIGAVLRVIRVNRGLSLEETARLVEVSAAEAVDIDTYQDYMKAKIFAAEMA